MSLLAKTKLLLISTLTPPRHSGCILPLWETHWFAGSNSSQPIWSSHSLEASVPSMFPPSDTCPAPPAADQVREESVQEALVPTCRGARGAEELESQLEQLVPNSCGFCLLKPGPIHQGLRKSEVSPVPQTGHDGHSLHLTPMCEAFQIAMARRRLAAQRACGARAEHPQGQQHRDREGHRDTGGSAGLPGGRSRQVLRTWDYGRLLKSEQRNFPFLGFSTFCPFLSFSTHCN